MKIIIKTVSFLILFTSAAQAAGGYGYTQNLAPSDWYNQQQHKQPNHCYGSSCFGKHRRLAPLPRY